MDRHEARTFDEEAEAADTTLEYEVLIDKAEQSNRWTPKEEQVKLARLVAEDRSAMS